jgi:hypothetical protein
MRRWLDTGAQAALCAVLALGLLMAATPRRLPPPAPETSVAPATRAMWFWQHDEPGPVVAWAAANGVRALFAFYGPRAAPADLDRSRAPRPAWS